MRLNIINRKILNPVFAIFKYIYHKNYYCGMNINITKGYTIFQKTNKSKYKKK
jgi:hypothetical protein